MSALPVSGLADRSQAMNKYAIFHSARIKSFPDGSSEVLVADHPIFREPGWEERPREGGGGKYRKIEEDVGDLSFYALERLEEEEERRARDNLARAKRRARTMLRDYALCTPMRYFLTLTFDPKKVDRYSVEDTVRKFGQWMGNQVRRRGIAYVAVAEYHKDGAVHFHALVTEGLKMADSGTMVPPEGGKPRRPRSAAQRALWTSQGGHTVYNVAGWPYGFSTAMELYGDYHAAVGYVCKYITKAEAKIGGRWYYSGGQLERPAVLFADLNFDEVCGAYHAEPIPCPALPGVRMAVVKIAPDLEGRDRRAAGGPSLQVPQDEVTSGGEEHNILCSNQTNVSKKENRSNVRNQVDAPVPAVRGAGLEGRERQADGVRDEDRSPGNVRQTDGGRGVRPLRPLL